MLDEYFQNTLGQSYPKKIKNKSPDFDIFNLEENGTVTARGETYGGRLGVGVNRMHLVEPTLVSFDLPGDDRVVEIYLGRSKSFFLTHQGRLYGCGDNYDGSLGIGSAKESLKPQPVLIPSGELVISIHASNFNDNANLGTATFVATKSGKIFAFGLNGERDESMWIHKLHIIMLPGRSRLGVGHTDQYVSVPEFVTKLNPNEVLLNIKTLAGNKRQDVDIFMKTNQRVLVYGSNAKGELGVGHSYPVMSPKPLELSANEQVAEIFLNYPIQNGLLATFIFTQSGHIMVCGESFNSKPGYIAGYSAVPHPTYYEIPPLLTLNNGKVSLLESEMVVNSDAPRCEQKLVRLKSTPLSLPIPNDYVVSMELLGRIWRFIGIQANYQCKEEKGKVIVEMETRAEPTAANVHFSGYHAGKVESQKQCTEDHITNTNKRVKVEYK